MAEDCRDHELREETAGALLIRRLKEVGLSHLFGVAATSISNSLSSWNPTPG